MATTFHYGIWSINLPVNWGHGSDRLGYFTFILRNAPWTNNLFPIYYNHRLTCRDLYIPTRHFGFRFLHFIYAKYLYIRGVQYVFKCKYIVIWNIVLKRRRILFTYFNNCILINLQVISNIFIMSHIRWLNDGQGTFTSHQAVRKQKP